MGVLGSILLIRPEVCDEIASLKADDFYNDANRKIYEHLREMYDGGDKIDITLLVSRLRTAGELRKDRRRGATWPSCPAPFPMRPTRSTTPTSSRRKRSIAS